MSRLDTSFLAHSNSSSAGLMTFHHTKRPALLATRGVPVLWLRTSSPEPNLGGGALRLGAIERRLKRPNPFYIVSIHPGLILGYIKTFVQRIRQITSLKPIILPRPEMGCVQGKSQIQDLFRSPSS
jgi:hypothetical protein